MSIYYAVVEVEGRVVSEYPVEGGEPGLVAEGIAKELGEGWPYWMPEDRPATCWVKLLASNEEAPEPLYYREHSLETGKWHDRKAPEEPTPRRSILDLKNSGGPTLGAGNAWGRTEGMSFIDKDYL